MIYLIDDKVSRKNDYGWSKEQSIAYKESLIHIETIEELSSNFKDLFKDGNVILYHESFFKDGQLKSNFENKLKEEEKHGIYIATFSGSKFYRKGEQTSSCHLPASVLYLNLRVFVDYCDKGDINFQYLCFGENYEIEKKLIDKTQEQKNKNFETRNEKGKISTDRNITYALSSFNSNSFSCLYSLPEEHVLENWDFDLEDIDLDKTVHKWLGKEIFDAIFIPLYFGETLSDYLGLRLAMHVRFTCTPNQFTPIFIYGVSDYKELSDNACFDILKTSGVFLIQANYDDFNNFNNLLLTLPIIDFDNEIKKIHLDIPSGIGDNHSVTNIWANERWKSVLGVENENESNERLNSLYFKYLKQVYPLRDEDKLVIQEGLNLNNDKIRLLYVDDEIDQWGHIIDKVLRTCGISKFNKLGSDFKYFSKEKIINLIVEEVKKEKINIIILDYRLHQDDFENTRKPSDISGSIILNKIKEYNPGIQVIIMSATNKAWSVQALIKGGADYFVLKESPLNNSSANFTKECIETLCDSIKSAIDRIYIFTVYNRITELKKLTGKLGLENKEVAAIEGHLDVAFVLLNQAYSWMDTKEIFFTKYLSLSYLQLFLVIETFIKSKSVIRMVNNKLYVHGKCKDYLILSLREKNKYDSSLKLEEDRNTYTLGKSTLESKYNDTNFKVSAVLIYLYGFNSSNLSDWPLVRDNRNQKTGAHADPKYRNIGIVQKDYEELLDFLELVLDIDKRVEKDFKDLKDLLSEEK